MKENSDSVCQFEEWQPLWKNSSLWINLGLILGSILVMLIGVLGLGGLILFMVVLVLYSPILIVAYFMGMKTDLTEKGLFVNIKPFTSRVGVSLRGATGVSVERYRPMHEYWGWGLRHDTRGPAYTMSGDRGVRIYYGEHKSVLIGSQHPQELADALTRILERRND